MEPARRTAGEWSPQGALTISRISELKEQLAHALSAFARVRIDLSGATAFDTSFLQLLCSSHRTAGAAGKELAVVGTTAEFLDTANKLGLHRRIGCDLACSGSCIWVACDNK